MVCEGRKSTVHSQWDSVDSFEDKFSSIFDAISIWQMRPDVDADKWLDELFKWCNRKLMERDFDLAIYNITYCYMCMAFGRMITAREAIEVLEVHSEFYMQ
ncbi:MAG: hypothetical protein CTR53_10300 [Ferrovibrio sp.]|nr:MAG: hypothetical protein CTR53_10300 [Ferrovibrio sp.]